MPMLPMRRSAKLMAGIDSKIDCDKKNAVLLSQDFHRTLGI